MSRPLSVLQLLPALESGGVERGTLEIGAELVRRGHRSLVISAGGRLVPALTAAGSEHFTWPIGRKSLTTLALVPRLRHFLRREGVDLLHARSRVPAWIAWLAWRGMDPARRPRFVTTVHGFYRVNRYSAIMTRGETVIAVSDSIRDYILRNYPAVPSERIQVIHRGIDPAAYPHGYRPPESWRRDWERVWPATRQRRLLTLPGRITRLKGHEDFLWLLRRLLDAGEPVHGLIVGGEHPRRQAYARALHQAAQRQGLADHLSFTGQRTDLREILAISDLVFSLSRQPESFGRTSLEALALGRPVIGYDHGGVGEILARLLPAGAVPAGDRAALLQRTRDWLAHPPRVPERQPFTLASMLSATIDLYQRNAPTRP